MREVVSTGNQLAALAAIDAGVNFLVDILLLLQVKLLMK
jgi:pyruvate/2-oxoacid:ferredoxin oxidoreductase alpha subunit